MLRSQTSTVQVRSMESRKPPIRVCTVGKVYRPDAVDATHMWMHHQLEGLWVESCRPVTMADLRTILRALQRGYLGPDTEVRLRPSYYPFVAGVEIDALWNGRWLEVGGAGLVDPNVLRNVGLDPEEVSGCACGLGIDRLVMIKCGIDDIRLLYQNDTRILARLG